jgi:Nucleotidyl transferase AbiEii toxin, Type IV TA system
MPADFLHNHSQFADLIRIVARDRGIDPKDDSPVHFMRHYYDVYRLLQRPEVKAFIGTDAYKAHKAKRFRPADNQNIAQNEAFILSDPETRKLYERAYVDSGALFYGTKPTFDQILKEIAAWKDRL